jgi:L-ascorbate metabolism protein UlaG (beta-lactamase superfamily)
VSNKVFYLLFPVILLLLLGLPGGMTVLSGCVSAVSEAAVKNPEAFADAYMKNEKLSTIRPDWPGNPLKDGRFINLGPDPHRSLLNVLKWKLSSNPQKKEKQQDKWKPLVRPQQELFSGSGDQIVWLGHASFAIRLGGINFIHDPVFFDVPFTPRQVGLSIDPSTIQGIDYVLLSHGHMDHTDKKSLQLLSQRNAFTLLAPLRLPELVQRWLPELSYQEAGWYQQYQLPDDAVKVFLLPAYHWYKRTPFDDDKRLWGSFILQTPSHTIYISGDSGYEDHFQEIAGLFPDIDICIMGVGAYKPAFVMETSHLSPLEAVNAFHDLGGKVFIPMHYGTYDLSDEPLGEPYRLLREQEQEGKIKGKLKVLDIGERYLMN